MGANQQLAAGGIIADRYRLVTPIGRGGMGTVWCAEDRRLERRVALKLVTPAPGSAAPSRTALGRFVREARAMAQLRSPHVVRVFDQGSDGVLAFIAMELLEGVSLRDRLRETGPLDTSTALRVFTHVGRAVALAHQRGIVHRDLKPGNIFLCASPTKLVCKVLDFGMVKSVAAPLATSNPVSTERGRPLGTPYYMSPEQARGEATVDHRADLWAIGVIAFECLCGQRPFRGKSLARVFSQIATAPLPLASDVAAVPEGFDAWLARALCRDVQRRFQSAKVMLEELRDVLGASSALDLTLGGSQSATLTAVVQTVMQPPGFGERTVRRPLRAASSSFVDRKSSIEALDQAIANHCRVLTLSGPAGIGKTRLARAYGLERADRFAGGVWICRLADATDAESLWLRLAVTLGVKLDDRAPARRIGRSLATLGSALVVLDSAGSVREPLTAAMLRWLRDAPRVHFLVTGVRGLSLPTVREIDLGSLPPPNESARTFDDLRRFPAAELFMRRAIAFNRRVLDQQQQAPAVGLLCRRVGGNPLAIELAASCVDALTPAEIAHGLAGASVHPGGTTIIVPDSILAGIIGWRVGQLAPYERAALVQCAAFRGGFNIEAGEAVVDLGPWPEAPPLAELAPHLARRALLEQVTDCDGEPRYRLHSAIQAWCQAQSHDTAELLETDPQGGAPAREEWVARHARYFAGFGSREALTALQGHGGWLRRARYAAEWHNLKAASEWATAHQAGNEIAATHLAMAALLRSANRHEAAADLLAVMGSAPASPSLTVDVALARGSALLACHRHETSAAALEQAYRQASALGDAARLAASLVALGDLHLERGGLDTAGACYQQAQELAAGSQLPLELACAERSLGVAHARSGDLDRASALLGRALSALGRLGVRSLQIGGLVDLAEVMLTQGRAVEARLNLDVALRIACELGDRVAEAQLLGRLGEISLVEGKAAGAAHQLDEAIGRSREIGAIEHEARWLAARAELHATRGEQQGARQLLRDAQQILSTEPPSPERAAVWAAGVRLALSSQQAQAAAAALAELDTMLSSLAAGSATRLRRELPALRQRVIQLSGAPPGGRPAPPRRP